MTELKAGDRAMVVVKQAGEKVAFVGDSWILKTALLPLPPAKTTAETALIARCTEMNWQESPNMQRLVDAVLAERAPPDPMEAGMVAYRSNGALSHDERMALAFKAYDAAKGSKT